MSAPGDYFRFKVGGGFVSVTAHRIGPKRLGVQDRDSGGTVNPNLLGP